MRTCMLTLLLSFIAAPLFAQEGAKTWVGTWNNRKYGTSGPLKCVAMQEEGGKWKATFSGKFQGDPFSYKATFQAKPGRGQQTLSGRATIRGHKYEWTGSMKGGRLNGRYRASVGYYGTFTLREQGGN